MSHFRLLLGRVCTLRSGFHGLRGTDSPYRLSASCQITQRRRRNCNSFLRTFV